MYHLLLLIIPALLNLLQKELRQATEMNFRVNAGKDEYICFAYPSHYGEAVFSVGGLKEGSEK